MSDLLKQAFEKAAEALPELEQDALGRRLLDLIEADDHDWERAFARRRNELEELGAEASEDFRTGRTEILDPDKL